MNYIASNIRYIRARKGFTQEYFAEELKWSRSMVMSFESGRTEPSINRLIELSKYTRIPIDTLIKTDLRKSKDVSFIEIANNRVLFPIMVDEENENIIEVIPIKATAGYLAGYDDPEYIEQLEKIKLPFLPTGKHRAFPIKGDSMLPVKNGAYIVGKYIEDFFDIKDGRTYIIVTLNDGMTYKRVYNNIADNGTLRLSPDNKNYQPYDVPISEVIEVWEYACSINTEEYDEAELKISSILQMFNSLGIELKALEKSIKQ
jgi:transcriptional regulator with XRE-family HTH domain